MGDDTPSRLRAALQRMAAVDTPDELRAALEHLAAEVKP